MSNKITNFVFVILLLAMLMLTIASSYISPKYLPIVSRIVYRLAVSVMLLLVSLLWGCSSHRGSRATAVKTPERVNLSAASARPAKALLEEADKWLGTPYKYGGDKRGKGVDCSGLVNRVYADALSISLPRNSAQQAEFCKAIDKKSLDIGDLVFFSPGGSGRINHVGMYIGDDCMIHASGSRGVMISRLSEPYFQRNYRSCGRVEEYERLLASSRPSKKDKKEKNNKVTTQPAPRPSVIQSLPRPVTELPTDPSSVPGVLEGKVRNDSVPGTSLTIRPDIEDILDQKVDSICSSFFD